MAAEALQQLRVSRGHRVEHIADVNAGYRARRSLDPARLTGCEGDHRAMDPLPDLRCDQADHTLVPVRVVDGQTRRKLAGQGFEQAIDLPDRITLHLCLELAALRVEPAEVAGVLPRLGIVAREETLDPETHVLESAGGVETWPRLEGEVLLDGGLEPATGRLEQGAQAGCAAAGADATDALSNENPVVAIERHHIGDGAQRDQVEQVGRVNARRIGHEAALDHRPCERRHHVEGDSHAGQRLRREGLPAEIRIYDGRRLRERPSRQVVIRDQHLDPEPRGLAHAFKRRDAVVHGDEQLWAQLCGFADDLRRETVAEAKPVRHDVSRIREPESPQLPHDQRRAGRPVGVEITDHYYARTARVAGDQELDRGRQSAQRSDRQQMTESQIKVLILVYTACRIDPAQDGVQTARQALERRGRHRAPQDPPLPHARSSVHARRLRHTARRSTRDTVYETSP